MEVQAVNSRFGERNASEILDLLNADTGILEPQSSSTLTIHTCGLCRGVVGTIIRRYSLPHEQRPVIDGTCVCGGKSQSESEALLQLALMVSGVKSVLVLGGSPDVDRAFDSVKCVKCSVVRQKQQAALQPQRISEIDVIVVARGQVGHSVTAPYLTAVRTLAQNERPVVLRPRSSNITAIADELIWARDDIYTNIGNRKL